MQKLRMRLRLGIWSAKTKKLLDEARDFIKFSGRFEQDEDDGELLWCASLPALSDADAQSRLSKELGEAALSGEPECKSLAVAAALIGGKREQAVFKFGEELVAEVEGKPRDPIASAALKALKEKLRLLWEKEVNAEYEAVHRIREAAKVEARLIESEIKQLEEAEHE